MLAEVEGRMKIFSLVSTWSLVGAVGCYVVQLAPIPGIFLMMMGGPALTGLLVDIFFIALFVEAVIGRIPRAMAVVPLLALGAYYAMFVEQTIAIRTRNAELRAVNPRPGSIAFDPTHMSLVDDEALNIVRQYTVSRAYRPAPEQVEDYFVNLLVTSEQCEDIPNDTQVRIRKVYGAGPGMGKHIGKICDLSFPARPTGQILEVSRSGDLYGRQARDGRESQTITEFRLDGALKARFTTVHTEKLAWFPLLIAGCVLIDNPSSWSCIVGFHKNRITLGDGSVEFDRTAPERIVLGLRPYSDQELENFRGYPENADLIATAGGIAKQVETDTFETLKRAFANESTPLPASMSHSIASSSPKQLVPLTNAFAHHFNALMRENGSVVMGCAGIANPDVTPDQLLGRKAWKQTIENGGDRRSFWDCWESHHTPAGRSELLRVLAAGLAALPAQDFRPYAPRLLDTLHQPAVNGDYPPNLYPLLYIRTGDAGPLISAALEQDYQANLFLPHLRKAAVLALCRAGSAGAQTIAAMKTDFANTPDDDNRQALVVTLLKLGQRDFVQQNLGNLRSRSQPWLQMLLDGKGWNAVGPNNCMIARDLGSADFVSPVMKPLLVREKGLKDNWIVATGP
jgi:hypothetical protein